MGGPPRHQPQTGDAHRVIPNRNPIRSCAASLTTRSAMRAAMSASPRRISPCWLTANRSSRWIPRPKLIPKRPRCLAPGRVNTPMKAARRAAFSTAPKAHPKTSRSLIPPPPHQRDLLGRRTGRQNHTGSRHRIHRSLSAADFNFKGCVGCETRRPRRLRVAYHAQT